MSATDSGKTSRRHLGLVLLTAVAAIVSSSILSLGRDVMEDTHQQRQKPPTTTQERPTMTIATLVPGNTLITLTPEEGRQLAIKMARLIIKATQPDDEVRKRLRDVYANDAGFLIQVGQLTAIEFATIAAANNYWRDVDGSRPTQPPQAADAT